MKTIVKRDGREVPFEKEKVREAIRKAFFAVDGEISSYAEEKAFTISSYIAGLEDETLSVEQVQDLVENGLMATRRKDVAKAYIRYRDERSRLRNRDNRVRQLAKEKLLGHNDEKQNANLDENSFGGRIGEATRVLTKSIALEDIMSKMSRDNHENNEIYIHDLDSYAVGLHNCLSIPFDDLLANGFTVRQTDVRPAGSVNTAFQLVAVIFQIQSLCQFGGVSATHLDWTMVPYVRKSFRKHYIDGLKYIYNIYDEDLFNHIPENAGIEDGEYMLYEKAYKYAMDMTEREVHQAAEGMFHNLNTLQSRSGNQLPFSSINYGTCTLPEGRMVTKAILECSIEGMGKLHRTSIFPCQIFQCMKGVNRAPGDPNYDLFRLALKSTSLRLYPNYANVDWSGNAGYDRNDPKTYFSTMGCRTANGYDINGFGQLKDGRGNICPVTIILPTLAMEEVQYWKNYPTGEDSPIEDFMDLLNKKIDEAKDMLIERFEWICSQPATAAQFMYENHTMAGYIPEEGIRSALKHGTLALG